jgi:hypothetical protein
MDPITIGLLAGLGKSMLVDQPKEQRQRKLASQTQLYSPWTGLKAQPVQDADTFGSALQGVTAGAMYKQGQQANDRADQELAMKSKLYSAFNGAQNPVLGGNSQIPVDQLDPSQIPQLKRQGLNYQNMQQQPSAWGQMQ